MFGRRRSTAAVLEHEISEAGSKAAETVTELAERALTIAREAGHVATPAIRSATHHSVEGLSRAAERASEALADTAQRLAKSGDVAPKPKRHRIRRILIFGAIVGAIVGLVRSPLRGKLTEKLFGPPPDDEPGSITLPYGENDEPASDNIEIHAEPAPPPPAATEGNGVSTSATSEPADTSRA